MVSRYSGLRRVLRSRWGIGVLTFLAVSAVLLIFGHRSHYTESNHALGACCWPVS